MISSSYVAMGSNWSRSISPILGTILSNHARSRIQFSFSIASLPLICLFRLLCLYRAGSKEAGASPFTQLERQNFAFAHCVLSDLHLWRQSVVPYHSMACQVVSIETTTSGVVGRGWNIPGRWRPGNHDPKVCRSWTSWFYTCRPAIVEVPIIFMFSCLLPLQSPKALTKYSAFFLSDPISRSPVASRENGSTIVSTLPCLLISDNSFVSGNWL